MRTGVLPPSLVPVLPSRSRALVGGAVLCGLGIRKVPDRRRQWTCNNPLRDDAAHASCFVFFIWTRPYPHYRDSAMK